MHRVASAGNTSTSVRARKEKRLTYVLNDAHDTKVILVLLYHLLLCYYLFSLSWLLGALTLQKYCHHNISWRFKQHASAVVAELIRVEVSRIVNTSLNLLAFCFCLLEHHPCDHQLSFSFKLGAFFFCKKLSR